MLPFMPEELWLFIDFLLILEFHQLSVQVIHWFLLQIHKVFFGIAWLIVDPSRFWSLMRHRGYKIGCINVLILPFGIIPSSWIRIDLFSDQLVILIHLLEIIILYIYDVIIDELLLLYFLLSPIDISHSEFWKFQIVLRIMFLVQIQILINFILFEIQKWLKNVVVLGIALLGQLKICVLELLCLLKLSLDLLFMWILIEEDGMRSVWRWSWSLLARIVLSTVIVVVAILNFVLHIYRILIGWHILIAVEYLYLLVLCILPILLVIMINLSWQVNQFLIYIWSISCFCCVLEFLLLSCDDIQILRDWAALKLLNQCVSHCLIVIAILSWILEPVWDFVIEVRSPLLFSNFSLCFLQLLFLQFPCQKPICCILIKLFGSNQLRVGRIRLIDHPR